MVHCTHVQTWADYGRKKLGVSGGCGKSGRTQFVGVLGKVDSDRVLNVLAKQRETFDY